MMKKEKRLFKIYVLGNPLLKEDSVSIKLLPKLRENFREIEFIEFDPTENFPEEDHLILIDTVINAKKITVIKDIEKIETSPNYSLHDFDLAFSLKLLTKLNKIKDFTIIGLPPFYNKDTIEELNKTISNLLLRND